MPGSNGTPAKTAKAAKPRKTANQRRAETLSDALTQMREGADAVNDLREKIGDMRDTAQDRAPDSERTEKITAAADALERIDDVFEILDELDGVEFDW